MRAHTVFSGFFALAWVSKIREMIKIGPIPENGEKLAKK